MNIMNIRLRKLTPKDAHDIYENVNDPDVSRWTALIPYPYPKSLATKFIRSSRYQIKNNKALIIGIESIGNKKIVGVISLTRINKTHKRAEIGYWLGKKYWGKGIMTQAVEEILHMAFKKMKLHRVYAKVFEENIASRKTLEKCGFQYEGLHKDSCFKHGKFRNVITYGIIAGSKQP